MKLRTALQSPEVVAAAFILLLVLVTIGLREINNLADAIATGQPLVVDLNKLQEKQIELFNEMNKLLTTLATLCFGALGALVFNRYKDRPLPRTQIWRAMTASSMLGLSLFGGYVSQERLVRMLDLGFFDIFNPSIYWFSQMQFWAFLIATLVLALFVYADFTKESDNANTIDAEPSNTVDGSPLSMFIRRDDVAGATANMGAGRTEDLRGNTGNAQSNLDESSAGTRSIGGPSGNTPP